MVIRVYYDSNECITTEEYEEMLRELEIKKITDTLTKGDVILAKVLYQISHRYYEIIHLRKYRDDPAYREQCDNR